MLLFGSEASGKGGANPKVWECFFRREVLKGVPFIQDTGYVGLRTIPEVVRRKE
jgi:hypothetical protein